MSTQLETNLQEILTQKETYLIPTNIRSGVTVLGVTGNLEPDKPDQSKTVTPTTSQQVVTADTGYELAQVTVNAVTSAIDSNITAANIKSGVTILGVTGTLPSDISYGTTLPANPNPGDKFVKVNVGWTELDGIYEYSRPRYSAHNVQLNNFDVSGIIPGYLSGTVGNAYDNYGYSFRSDKELNIIKIDITTEATPSITTFPYHMNKAGDQDWTVYIPRTYSRDIVYNSVINEIVIEDPNGEYAWHKIEFTNSISGTEYDTAVDTTEDILGTSNGE